MTNFVYDLQKIVGKHNISTEEIDRVVYSFDASELEGNAKAVVWINSQQELIKIVKLANKKKIPLVVRGGGTSLAGSVVPQDSIVVDISKLNKILKIDQKQKYAIVESGVILDHLNYELKKYNLTFPVLPASHKVVTVGGIISTNAVGIRAVKYGKTRDWIAEMKVITGNGIVKIVKNKEIEDFCGSEGTLGIILEAKLKLIEPVKKITVSLFKFNDLEAMMNKVKELKDKTVALEFIDKLIAEIQGFDKAYYLIAEFESDEGEIKDEEKIKEIWRMRDGAYPSLAANGYPIIIDPLVPIENMKIFLSKLEEMKIPSIAHIGVGIVHPCLEQKSFDKKEQIIKLAIELGGKVSGEHGIGLTKKEFLEESLVKKMKSLNKKYDKKNILNRGKIV